MKKQCKIVEDLIPLYHDGICSEESKQLVEAHLSQCGHCKNLLAQIDGDLLPPAGTGEDMKPLTSITKAIEKDKRKALITGISIALAVVLLLSASAGIWWYAQEYTYYLAFAEGHSPHAIHELREDGSIIQSIVTNANRYTWYDDTYEYNVTVPSFLSRDGHVDMTRLDTTETQHISVGISRWYDEEFVFHVSIVRADTYMYFIVDSELNQYYPDHWTDEQISSNSQAFEAHQEEVTALVSAAKEMWPFLNE